MSFLARRAATSASAAASAGAAAARRTFSASARRDIAKLTLIGNLAAPPEAKATSTGRNMVEYAIASNDGWGENAHTSWFRVAAFVEEGPRRDFLTNLPKGSTLYVEGDVVLNSYTDGDGKTRSGMSVYQRNLQVLRRGSSQNSEHNE